MENQQEESRVRRWMIRRIQFKGLKPRYAAYTIAGFWTFAVVVFGVIERLADPTTFTSVWLGFWWSIQTVTTVGYGDVVPGQTSGKVMASVLMIGGLSLLAVVTAVITSAFVERRRAEIQKSGDDPVMQQLEQIVAQLDQVKKDLARLER